MLSKGEVKSIQDIVRKIKILEEIKLEYMKTKASTERILVVTTSLRVLYWVLGVD